MDQHQIARILRETFRDQLLCLGRIVVRHQLPDDVVWDIAKAFQIIYHRAQQHAKIVLKQPEPPVPPHCTTPHPGLMYALSTLEREAPCSRKAKKTKNG